MKTWKVKVRGKNKYCVVVPTKQIDEFGNPKVKRFFHSKKHEAVAKAMDFLHNDLGSSVTIKSLKKITLEKVYDETWDSWNIKVLQKEKNPKKKNTITRDTMNRYEDYANALFKIVPRETDIGLIDKKWVNDFIKKLHQTKSESQAYRIYSVFNMIMLKAEQLDYIEFSPTHAFKQDRPTYSSAGKKAIDPKEMKQIFLELFWGWKVSQVNVQEKRIWEKSPYIEMKKEMDKNNIQVLKRVNNIWREAENQTALILLLQALTGARWGEIAALTVADINLKKCSINISKSRSAKRGTVSLTKSGHLRSNEADMGTRVVYFAPSFAKEIKYYINKNNVSKDGYLFDCSYSTTQKTFLRACKRAGSLQKETKIFRRYVSTMMRSKFKASRDDVRLALGHSNDATQDIYVTHSNDNAVIYAHQLFKTLN